LYVDASVSDTDRIRAIAALMLHPEGAWISHQTAAQMYGVVVPNSPLTHVSVQRAEDRRWSDGIKPHLAPPGDHAQLHSTIPVSRPIRMFIELSGVLDLVDLVVAGDSMLRVFGMTADALRGALANRVDYWSGTARFAAAFVRDEVDSPMETRLRMLIVLAGLPEPRVNYKVRDAHGNVIVRFDLSYPAERLAVEYDGRQHVEVVAQWESDEERREYLDEIEWRIVKVRSYGVYRDPGRTVERVWRALRSRGRSVRAPGDGWKRHFPERRTAA
jgi:very-short-patch-repair endonuclease